MELGFASLVVVRLHALDGIVRSGLGVDGTVDDAEGPRAQNRLYPERAVVDSLTQQAVCERRIGRHSGWGVEGRQPSTDFSALSWVGGGSLLATRQWSGGWVVGWLTLDGFTCRLGAILWTFGI